MVKLSDLVVVPPDSPKFKRNHVLLGIYTAIQNRPEFFDCTLTQEQICQMLPDVEPETVTTALDAVANSGPMVDARFGRDPRQFNFTSIPGGLRVEVIKPAECT